MAQFNFADTVEKWSIPITLYKVVETLVSRRPVRTETQYTIKGIVRLIKEEQLIEKPGKEAPQAVATLRTLKGPLEAINEDTQLPEQVTLKYGDEIELSGYRYKIDVSDPTIPLYSDVEIFNLTEVVVRDQV